MHEAPPTSPLLDCPLENTENPLLLGGAVGPLRRCPGRYFNQVGAGGKSCVSYIFSFGGLGPILFLWHGGNSVLLKCKATVQWFGNPCLP